MLERKNKEKLIPTSIFSGLAFDSLALTNKTDASSSCKRRLSKTSTTILVKRSKENWRRTKEIRSTAQEISRRDDQWNAVFLSSQTKWLKTKQRLKSRRPKGISLLSFSEIAPFSQLKTFDPRKRKATTMACFSTAWLTTLWSKLGIPKETVLVANPFGRTKTNLKIQVLALRMSILHTLQSSWSPCHGQFWSKYQW